MLPIPERRRKRSRNADYKTSASPMELLDRSIKLLGALNDTIAASSLTAASLTPAKQCEGVGGQAGVGKVDVYEDHTGGRN